MTIKEQIALKRQLKKLTPEHKEFIRLMNNYAVALCVSNDAQSINELCEIIKYQNERRRANV